MKNKVIILLLTIMLFSRNSDDNRITELQEESFTVQLVTINSTVNIDELATGLPDKFEKN
ncbi:hypothetical protein [Tenacibaculum maritimum]|uniref:hypothetical protein n=1 Tax=Tenacibaculum maritimum TaxID=107401 RepID=UPI0013302B87|nr:hypothetical protein [Tenacibaculum maritimum]MCD9583217.1 hypothetical protein [Tenacibaculum maritimum]MCD9637153.1 hypothetical protein [Tenacibaculum maritimum]